MAKMLENRTRPRPLNPRVKLGQLVRSGGVLYAINGIAAGLQNTGKSPFPYGGPAPVTSAGLGRTGGRTSPDLGSAGPGAATQTKVLPFNHRVRRK
ncbi:MAG TPA: hypothetical protein VHK65_14300 [Candidatus Dormibacteraeota bacterium]|nr:hypothetical protein [Candidatus Dormibacteraeota bacterium]